MKSRKYWENAALLREQAIHDGAVYTAKEIRALYYEALEDIEDEIQTIKNNFAKRYGIDNRTASYFLSRAQREGHLERLSLAMAQAPDSRAREDILEYIHRDGLSVRAYGARIERYNALKDVVYSHIKALGAAEVLAVGDMLKRAYKASYYGHMDDTAKGINMGVSFAMINEDAVEAAVDAKWHGERFSKRIWNNTDDLAKKAQDLVVKSVINGESWKKTARKLREEFDVNVFHSETLIRTEASRVHAQADKKAYEDMGIERYRFLATLDNITCEKCQALDGKEFYVKDIAEGDNYPTIHPRCRCTTTMASVPGKRRAKNPSNGKSEIIDGSVTYREWVANMPREQREALELARKKNDRKTADKVQHKRYMNVLGAKNVPRAFDKFQDLKYNDKEKWNEIKELYHAETKPYLQERLDYIYNGEKNFIPTGAVMTTARTIAGEGSKTELRVEDKLIKTFGGQQGEWRKRVGKIESEKYIFDVHWYELNGKQYEAKVKHRGDRK